MSLKDPLENIRDTFMVCTLLFGPIFAICYYQIVYLQSMLDNKPVDYLVKKYYTIISLVAVVLLGIILLLILIGRPTAAGNSWKDEYFIPFVIIGSLFALYLYNYIIINKGEHPARGAIITNLIILYPCLLATVIGFLVTLFYALFR